MRIVLYHANCSDGFGAAYAVAQRYGTSDTTYRAVQYRDELRLDDFDGVGELYLLDITFALPTMMALRDRAKRLIVIDHHRTAEAVLRYFDCNVKIFDLEHSAAWLTYRYLYPEQDMQDMPILYDYIEDRDLWRFSYPLSREINAYIRSFAHSFGVWSEVETSLELRFDSCIEQGVAILRSQQQTVDALQSEAFMSRIAGYTVPVVNANHLLSEIGESLLKRFPDAPFAAVYFDTPSHRVYSLRSSERFDCSLVAQAFGGGGHARAAGFSLPLEHTPLEVPASER